MNTEKGRARDADATTEAPAGQTSGSLPAAQTQPNAELFASSPATAPSSAAPAAPGTAPGAEHPRPVRWGGIVWGVILMGFAASALFVLSSRERLLSAQVWLSALNPASAWALAIAAAGGIIVVIAVLAGVRGAQRRRRA